MTSAHYSGSDLVIRKIEVGTMENNVYVIECPETHEAFIVDGSFEADKIMSAAEGATVIGILQTHGHFDHVQALAELKQALDVPVFAHSGDDYPIPIDTELKDGDILQMGKREVTVLHTPGHTAGSVCFAIGEHLIAGDTLFPGGPGNTWGDKDAFAEIIASIQSKLLVLPDTTRVYPGHGADTTIGAEEPHLQEWIERGW